MLKPKKFSIEEKSLKNPSRKFHTKGVLFFIFSLFSLMFYLLSQQSFEPPLKQSSDPVFSLRLNGCEKWILSPHSECHLKSPESLLWIEDNKLLQKYENASIELTTKDKKSYLTSSTLESNPTTSSLIAQDLFFHTENLKGRAKKAVIHIDGKELTLEDVRLEQAEVS